MPTRKVPESTVICSSVGWKCDLMVYPLGRRSRIVNAPDLPGSPWITAKRACAGRKAGAGPHFTAAAECIWATAGTATRQQRRKAAVMRMDGSVRGGETIEADTADGKVTVSKR